MEFLIGLIAIAIFIFIILKIAKKVRPKTPTEFKPENSLLYKQPTAKTSIPEKKGEEFTPLNRPIHEIENEERKKLTEILSEPFDLAPEDSKPFFVFFDTETTGFVPEYTDVKDFKEFPFPVQLAWAVFDFEGRLIKERDFILLQPTEIPQDAAKVHKITTQKMIDKGVDPIPVYEEFVSDLKSAQYLVAHNLEYDDKVMKSEFHRKGLKPSLLSKKRICTMKKFKKFCDIPYKSGTGTKYPKLSEFAVCAFNMNLNPSRFSIKSGHNALVDVQVTAKCFFEMLHTWEEITIERD